MATSFAIGQLENTSIKLQQSIKELTSRISQYHKYFFQLSASTETRTEIERDEV